MKIFKYFLLVISFFIFYGMSISDSLSAAESEPEVCSSESPSPTSKLPTLFNKGDLIFGEVMPNPKGKDAGVEWLELKNTTNKDIQLLDFILSINDKKYDLPEMTIAAGQKLHATSKDLKITLPNKATTLILQDSAGKEIDRLAYTDAKDDQIFSHEKEASKITTTLKLPTSGNTGSLLVSASATFLIRLWLKDRIS